MSNFDLHEFNILSQRHNYFMTNNRINGFPVLNESSVFLKKILAQRTNNSSDKTISINILNPDESFKNKIRMYKSPEILKKGINTDNRYNIESFKPNNSRKINNQKIISPTRNNNDITLLNRIVTPTYYKIPINVTNRLSKSPDIGKNFTVNNQLDNEVKVLNIGGKKIFANNSFNGFRNFTQNNNTPKKIETSELFRNYDELKKKKEEIFKRKMKRDSSLYRIELLKRQKDKEIKEQSIKLNFLNNKDKLRIIPLKKKLITKERNNANLHLHNNLYSKKKFKTNNIFISKNIKNKEKLNNNINNNINNNQSPINKKIKENLEYLRTKNEKSKTLNPQDRINNVYELKTKNKKFVEDYNPNLSQIIYSNDRKISIKMNILKDKNVIFPKEKGNINKKNYEIQKLITIFYKCSKKTEKIKNKKMVKRIKNMNNLNTDILSSIKEEEEKSKNKSNVKEVIKNEKPIEEIKKERPLSSFSGGVRSKYLNRLKKK